MQSERQSLLSIVKSGRHFNPNSIHLTHTYRKGSDMQTGLNTLTVLWRKYSTDKLDLYINQPNLSNLHFNVLAHKSWRGKAAKITDEKCLLQSWYLSLVVQVKPCIIQLHNLIIGNMYTGIKVHCKSKNKLYPVRPDKISWTFLIISRIRVSHVIIFYFYPFGMF